MHDYPAQAGRSVTEPRGSLNQVLSLESSIVEPTTLFKGRHVAALHRWWAGQFAATGKIPRRSAFDITAHAALAPYLFLVDTPEDGQYGFRLLGEMVVEMTGHNIAHMPVTTYSPIEYGHDLYAYYREIVRTGRCYMCHGSLAFAGKDYRNFESIDCPLADEDGRVFQIIGAMDYV
jgi:hypothetical protein